MKEENKNKLSDLYNQLDKLNEQAEVIRTNIKNVTNEITAEEAICTIGKTIMIDNIAYKCDSIGIIPSTLKLIYGFIRIIDSVYIGMTEDELNHKLNSNND